MNKDDKLGALWCGKSQNGVEYMSGEINGKRVIVFKNKFKKEDKHPDYVIYKAIDKDDMPQNTQQINISQNKYDDDVPF
jgi:hypothetical protein